MFLHVKLGSFVRVMPGVKRVPPCGMCMMRRFFVRSTFMMLSGFAVVAGGMRMVFCRLFVVLSCFLGHCVFPPFVAPAGTDYSHGKLGMLTSAKLCFLPQNLHDDADHNARRKTSNPALGVSNRRPTWKAVPGLGDWRLRRHAVGYNLKWTPGAGPLMPLS